MNETTNQTKLPEYFTTSTTDNVTFVFETQENGNLGYVIRLPDGAQGNTREV